MLNGINLEKLQKYTHLIKKEEKEAYSSYGITAQWQGGTKSKVVTYNQKMRKQLFLLGFFFSIITLQAQKRDKGTIEIIPNIGYSSSGFNGGNENDFSTRLSIQFGVIGDYYLNDRWSLRSGLSYFGMGGSIHGSDLEYQLDYLNIPVNVNWHFGSTRKWNLNLGVTPGFLIKGNLLGDNVKDFHELFQLGISWGLGYKIEISENFSILIDGQFLYGVTKTLNDDFKRKNGGASINIGGVFSF